MKNPFQNAKVIGANIAVETYIRTDKARGDMDYPISRSDLGHISHCARRWKRGYKRKDTKALDWGNIIDALVSESFETKYAVAPATYKETGMECPTCKSVTTAKTCAKCKSAGLPHVREPIAIEKPWDRGVDVCKEWEKATGKLAIKAEEFQGAKEAYDELKADEEIMELLRVSAKQVMVIGEYKDDATGIIVPVKILLDLVPDKDSDRFGKCLSDFKTSTSAAPFLWHKFVDKFGYDMQAALYLDLYVAATGEDRTNWLHAIQENYTPWEVGRMMLTEGDERVPGFLTLGRAKYLHALQFYCRCLALNVWPGYGQDKEWLHCCPDRFMIERPSTELPALEESPPESTDETDVAPDDITP